MIFVNASCLNGISNFRVLEKSMILPVLETSQGVVFLQTISPGQIP
jgi:hypothetical protein